MAGESVIGLLLLAVGAALVVAVVGLCLWDEGFFWPPRFKP